MTPRGTSTLEPPFVPATPAASAPVPAPPADLENQVRAGSRARREGQRTQLRSDILRSAGELLLESGYAAFSQRKLAVRIGYTATTIYRYYRNKDELIRAVLDEGFRDLSERLDRAAASESDPIDRIPAMGRAYLRFGLENPVYYRLMFMQRTGDWGALSEDAQEPRMAAFHLLRGTVEAVIASGRTRHGIYEINPLTYALWAQMHGIVSLGLTMPFVSANEIEVINESALEMAVRGMEAS